MKLNKSNCLLNRYKCFKYIVYFKLQNKICHVSSSSRFFDRFKSVYLIKLNVKTRYKLLIKVFKCLKQYVS